MTVVRDPGAVPWDAWTPGQLAEGLAGVDLPWYVVGGWALDLWRCGQTRVHEDLEFCVLAAHVPVFLRHFSTFEFWAAVEGRLVPLADAPVGAKQYWAFDPVAGRWRFDMMVEAGDLDRWVYKRDPGLTEARDGMVWRTAEGVAYLSPAAVLLFKAKQCRDKDQEDFDRFAPELSEADRDWLRRQLLRMHPGHPWLGRL